MARDYERAALAAGWKPALRMQGENQRVKWMYPQLSLRVWAEVDGVHLLAYVETAGDASKVVHTEVARACWQPAGVTEWDVVDWGRRALTRWLGDNHPEVEEFEVGD